MKFLYALSALFIGVSGQTFANNGGGNGDENDESLSCPTIVVTGTNVNCYGGNNGTASVAIAGGSGSYSISWSTSPASNTANIVGLTPGTYTVHVADLGTGCTVVGAYVVDQPNLLQVSAITTDLNCNGVATGEIDLTVTGGTGTITTDWTHITGASNPQDLTGLSAGTYTVDISDANGCQLLGNSYTLTQPAFPLAATGIVSNVECSGENNGEIDLSVSGGTPTYSYAWSTGAATQDVSGLFAGSYTVGITDQRGCFLSVPFTITQPAALGFTMNTSDVLCFGESTGSVGISVTGGTTPYDYEWENSAVVFGANVPTLTNIAADNYQVEVTDANGCQVTGNAVVNEPIDLTITGSMTAVSCYGGNDGTITINPVGGLGAYTYSWTSLGGFTSVAQNLTNLFADIYTVVVTDGNGCTESFTIEVTQPLEPLTSTYMVTNVLCFGNNTGAIDVTVNGGTAPYTYSWTSGETTEDINGLFAGTYTYTVTDALNCTTSETVVVTQPAAPLSLTSTVTDVLCFGESNGVIQTVVAGGTAPYTYAWSNSSFLLSATSPDLNDFAADWYYLDVVDDNGCILVDSFEITQPPLLVSSIDPTDILCYGDNTGAIDLTVGGGTMPYTYGWNTGDVVEDLVNLFAGSYSVVVTDDNGCIVEDSVTLTQPDDSLSYIFETEMVTCNDGTDGEIEITVAGGTTPYSYAWSNGDTTSVITDLTAGWYTFVVTDFNACTLSDSIEITQPDPLDIAFNMTPVSCNGLIDGDIDITPSGGTAPYGFTWYNSDFSLSAQTEDLIDFAADTYQLEMTDTNNCFYEIFIEITQPDSLIATYTYNVISCKDGSDGNIEVEVTGGNPGYTFAWSNGATTQDLLGVPSAEYSLVITDMLGCQDSIDQFLAEPDSIDMWFETVSVSCIDEFDGYAIAYPLGGNGGYTYAWSNGSTDFDASGLENTTYSVTITDLLGCVGTGTVFIPKDSVGCINPVSAFSPNGDLYNDTWVIDNMDLYPDAEVQVFNKWGNEVHQQRGVYEPWDGTFKDDILPSETYYYIIRLNVPDRDHLTGTITIIR